MHRYYKISREWTEKLGETETAPRHPDGFHLFTPGIAYRVCDILREEKGLNLLRAEAMEYIGAIGLTVAEAHASRKGELRHDQPAQVPEPETEIGDNTDNTDNADNAQRITSNV